MSFHAMNLAVGAKSSAFFFFCIIIIIIIILLRQWQHTYKKHIKYT